MKTNLLQNEPATPSSTTIRPFFHRGKHPSQVNVLGEKNFDQFIIPVYSKCLPSRHPNPKSHLPCSPPAFVYLLSTTCPPTQRLETEPKMCSPAWRAFGDKSLSRWKRIAAFTVCTFHATIVTLGDHVRSDTPCERKAQPAWSLAPLVCAA